MISLKLDHETALLTLTPDDGPFNLLNTKTIRELIEHIETLYELPAKVLRISGTGGSFAVGADIKTMLGYSGYTAKGFSMLGNRLFKLMQNIPQVVIAEIDGFCMGGGMDFAVACDFRFATEDSKFAHPGTKLGIITGFGGTQRITRIMKRPQVTELFISGNIFDAHFMLEGGYLFGVAPSSETLTKTVDIFTEKILNKPKIFLHDMKSTINSHR